MRSTFTLRLEWCPPWWFNAHRPDKEENIVWKHALRCYEKAIIKVNSLIIIIHSSNGIHVKWPKPSKSVVYRCLTFILTYPFEFPLQRNHTCNNWIHLLRHDLCSSWVQFANETINSHFIVWYAFVDELSSVFEFCLEKAEKNSFLSSMRIVYFENESKCWFYYFSVSRISPRAVSKFLKCRKSFVSLIKIHLKIEPKSKSFKFNGINVLAGFVTAILTSNLPGNRSNAFGRISIHVINLMIEIL